MKFNDFLYLLVLTSISTWYVVNFDQIRMDLSISNACKCLGKKLLSEEALENTTLRNGHVSSAKKMFWIVNFYAPAIKWQGGI